MMDLTKIFNVKGRIALVTGGSSGIGFMICQGLIQNGCTVYLCGLPSDPIDERVAELNATGPGHAIGFPGDVSTKPGISAIASFLSNHVPHLDMLISNAGIRRDAPIPSSHPCTSLSALQASLWSHDDETDWAATFRVNTSAHFFLTVALLPLLAAAADLDVGEKGEGRKGRDDGRGVVVCTSSCASLHNCTNVDLTSYASSKAATDHLVRMLAAKVAGVGVRVNAMNPGCEYSLRVVPSNMNKVGADGNMFEKLIDKVPAKRVGRTEDMVGAILYLCSRAGSYVDGQCLCIDGGRTLFANGQE